MNLRALSFLILGLVAAAALFALLRPPADNAPATPVISQTPTGPAVPIAPEPPAPVASSFDFVVRNGERVAGPVTMQAKEGDDVEIKVTSDQPDELHLHGYDLHTALKANEAGALYFKATHSGRFDVELHHANLTLGTLEVQPK